MAAAFLEAASGEFSGTVCASVQEARELLARLRPKEILLPEGAGVDGLAVEELGGAVITLRPSSWFDAGRSEELLRRALGVGSLRAFELEPGEPLVGAAGALVEYLSATQGGMPRHLRAFERRRLSGSLVLDAAAVRNLEVLRDASGEKRASLARVLDHTVTAMGARLHARLVGAAARSTRPRPRPATTPWRRSSTSPIASRRCGSRCGGWATWSEPPQGWGCRQARPGELVGLRAALAVLPELRGELAASPSQLLAALGEQVDALDDLQADLAARLPTNRPRSWAPGRSGRGATRSWTKRGSSPAGPRRCSESSRRGSDPAPASPTSGFATTGCSATRSRFPAPTWTGFRPSGCAGRRSPARSGSSPRSWRSWSDASPPRRRAPMSARGSCTPRCSSAVRPRVARSRHRPRGGGGGRPVLVSRTGRGGPTTSGRAWSRVHGSASSLSRHPVVEELSRRAVRPQRRRARRRRRARSWCSPARTWAASRPTCARSRCAVIMARAGSFVAAERGGDRRDRPRLHPRRRRRRPGARRVHVHGRDDRGGEHPPPRHPQLAGHARRGGPRHRDVRRPVAGVGGRRGAPRRARRRAPGRWCCSPPTTTSSPTSPSGSTGSSTRRWRSRSGRGTRALPPPRRGRVRPTARTGSTSPSSPGCRTSVCRRAAGGAAPARAPGAQGRGGHAPGPQQVQLGLFPPVEDAVARAAAEAGARAPDPDRGAQPARRAQAGGGE